MFKVFFSNFLIIYPQEHVFSMQTACKAVYNINCNKNRVIFYLKYIVHYIRLLFKLESCLLSNRKHYWWVSDWYRVDTQIGKFMNRILFSKTLEYFRLLKNNMGWNIIQGNIWAFLMNILTFSKIYGSLGPC